MALPTQWTWTWANTRRWWGIGRPGVLQSMGSQRVRHGLVTEQKLFKAALSAQKIEKTELSHTRLAPTYASPPPWSILPTTVVHLLQSMKLHRHITSPKVQFTSWFTLGAAYPVGLEEWIMPSIHQHSIIQSSFIALKILCALPVHPRFFFFFFFESLGLSSSVPKCYLRASHLVAQKQKLKFSFWLCLQKGSFYGWRKKPCSSTIMIRGSKSTGLYI